MSILLAMAFSAGLVAPVPECFVTRLACPVKASYANQGLSADRANDPTAPSLCCRGVKHHLSAGVPSSCLGNGKGFKHYVPDLENSEAPVLPVSLPLAFFQSPLSPDSSHFAFHALSRLDPLDPIPILLKKQSRLI